MNKWIIAAMYLSLDNNKIFFFFFSQKKFLGIGARNSILGHFIHLWYTRQTLPPPTHFLILGRWPSLGIIWCTSLRNLHMATSPRPLIGTNQWIGDRSGRQAICTVSWTPDLAGAPSTIIQVDRLTGIGWSIQFRSACCIECSPATLYWVGIQKIPALVSQPLSCNFAQWTFLRDVPGSRKTLMEDTCLIRLLLGLNLNSTGLSQSLVFQTMTISLTISDKFCNN